MLPTPPGWPRISSAVHYQDPSTAIDWLCKAFGFDDVEAHCKRAREAGAIIVAEPATTDYGEDYWTDRGYEAADPEGHHWWFYQRLRNPPAKKS